MPEKGVLVVDPRLPYIEAHTSAFHADENLLLKLERRIRSVRPADKLPLVPWEGREASN
jgi:hypothetical protein